MACNGFDRPSLILRAAARKGNAVPCRNAPAAELRPKVNGKILVGKTRRGLKHDIGPCMQRLFSLRFERGRGRHGKNVRHAAANRLQKRRQHIELLRIALGSHFLRHKRVHPSIFRLPGKGPHDDFFACSVAIKKRSRALLSNNGPIKAFPDSDKVPQFLQIRRTPLKADLAVDEVHAGQDRQIIPKSQHPDFVLWIVCLYCFAQRSRKDAVPQVAHAQNRNTHKK